MDENGGERGKDVFSAQTGRGIFSDIYSIYGNGMYNTNLNNMCSWSVTCKCSFARLSIFVIKRFFYCLCYYNDYCYILLNNIVAYIACIDNTVHVMYICLFHVA